MTTPTNARPALAPTRPGLLARVFATPDELGSLPHAWLLFLGFFIVPMLAMPISGSRFWLCVSGIAVFLPMYYAAFRRSGRAMYGPIAGITLLGMLLTPINLGANVFFNYAAFLCGQAMAPRRAFVAVGFMCAWMLAASYALDLPDYYFYPGIIVALGLVGISINIRQQDLANSALKRSQEEVHRLGQMAERERIARDLHDVLGHTLSVITLKADLASKLLKDDPAAAARELEELAATSREALASVRETVGNYRRVGFGDELDAAKTALKRADVALATDVDDVSLSARHATLLALVVREAVTNIIRHARAAHCQISLKQDDETITLRISDDGIGFDGGEGQGMTGMRERLAVLGGRMDIESNNGTHLIIHLPTSLNP
ncbi:MAG: sensor histidine kinase [Pseudomonadota bacterium]